MDAVTIVPEPENEPVRTYAHGSPERASLQARLAELKDAVEDMDFMSYADEATARWTPGEKGDGTRGRGLDIARMITAGRSVRMI